MASGAPGTPAGCVTDQLGRPLHPHGTGSAPCSRPATATRFRRIAQPDARPRLRWRAQLLGPVFHESCRGSNAAGCVAQSDIHGRGIRLEDRKRFILSAFLGRDSWNTAPKSAHANVASARIRLSQSCGTGVLLRVDYQGAEPVPSGWRGTPK